MKSHLPALIVAIISFSGCTRDYDPEVVGFLHDQHEHSRLFVPFYTRYVEKGGLKGDYGTAASFNLFTLTLNTYYGRVKGHRQMTFFQSPGHGGRIPHDVFVAIHKYALELGHAKASLWITAARRQGWLRRLDQLDRHEVMDALEGTLCDAWSQLMIPSLVQWYKNGPPGRIPRWLRRPRVVQWFGEIVRDEDVEMALQRASPDAIAEGVGWNWQSHQWPWNRDYMRYVKSMHALPPSEATLLAYPNGKAALVGWPD